LFNQQLQYFVHWKGYIWYMALANALGNLLNIYQMSSTRWKKIHWHYPNKPKVILYGTHCYKERWCHEWHC
jgi:hypothetical protein